MNNEVWVTWIDADLEQRWALVLGLQVIAVIEHLRHAFVNQQNLHSISPAKIDVRETEEGEKLRPSTKIRDYFVDSEDRTKNDRPGSSEERALVLTLPSSSSSTHGYPGHKDSTLSNITSANSETVPRIDFTANAILERSKKIMDAWTKELDFLPSSNLQEIKALVESKLPMPIPVTNFSSAQLDGPEHDVIKAADYGKAQLVPELEGLRSNILVQQRHGVSEDTLHGIVENLIVTPMNFLAQHVGVSLRFNRNSVDGSGATIKNLRPDLLTWLPSGVLAFKGEEKATAEDLAVATQELYTKLSTFSYTFFGSLPYQLCYALGGEMIQFCAIIRQDNGRSQLHRITEATNLSTIRGRSLCVRYVVNITRMLVAMQRSFPDGNAISLGSEITSRGSRVFILSDYVIKKATLFTGREVLAHIYKLLEASRGVEGLIRSYSKPKSSQREFTVYLEPVGVCGQLPMNIIEVKQAGRRILQALVFLHEKNIVHRDLRPDNVMFADRDWYLIDLEWANFADSELGEYTPASSWSPPEISSANCKWTCACDMWQFGKLVELWGNVDEAGKSYVRVQSKIDPAERLSAEASLHHIFFS